jgi:signal transduction histidine kinase
MIFTGKWNRLVSVILLSALLLITTDARSHLQNDLEKKSRHILIVSSYSNGYTWSDEIIDYVGGELNSRHDHYEVSVEHISAEYNTDFNVWTYRFNIITSAYKDHPPDVMVLIGDEAWHAYRNSIKREGFERVQVVVVAAKSVSFTSEQLANPDSVSYSHLESTKDLMEGMGVTGVLRELNLSGLFEVMEGLIQPLRRVYVLTDHRIQGRYSRLMIEDIVGTRGQPEAVYISSRDVTTDSLLSMVRNFSDSSAVFISSWFTSGFGFRYSINYTYTRIAANTKLPIFGIVDRAIETGIFTGGYFMPQNFWGGKAVELIEEVERRGSANLVPVETYRDSLFHINWENARARGISRLDIPKGSKIYARPVDFFLKYKEEIIIIGGFLIIIILSALLVLRSYIQVRAAKKRLMDSEDNLFKALRKSQESDRLKSSFLANMSHEIRTPLNSILGFSELLSETYDESERRQYTKLISSSSDLLLRLIDDILDLSKIEAGTYEFVFERVDLCEMLDELKQIFEHKVKSGVDFNVECKYDKLEIFADRKRLFQVLTNLVDNAMKFTTSGFVKVKADIEEFDGLRMAAIEIEDSGLGIQKEKLDTIFERFVKLNDFSEGTGLGLTICNTIINKHKGTIEVQSKYGVGSKFTVRIPI